MGNTFGEGIGAFRISLSRSIAEMQAHFYSEQYFSGYPPRQLVVPLTTHFANKTTNRDKVTTNSNSIIFGDYSIILIGTTHGNK